MQYQRFLLLLLPVLAILIVYQYAFTVSNRNVKTFQCGSLKEAGVEAYNRSRYDVAQASLQEALRCFQDIANRAEEGNTLNNIAVVFASQGRNEEALERFEQTLVIRREVGDRAGEGITLNNIAAVNEHQGRYEEALERYNQALAILREMRDRTTEGTTLNNIAVVYSDQGRYQEALEAYEQALVVAREVGNRAGEGKTLNNMAGVYGRQGRFDEALEAYEQALVIAREMGDRAAEGATLTGIALVFTSQGRYQAGLDTYQQALVIRREVGDRAGEGSTLNNIALVYHNQGRYQEAIETFDQSLAIVRQVGDRATEGQILNNVAAVYGRQGRYQEALETYKQALATMRAIGDHATEGTIFNNIALVFDNQKRYEEALDTYEQALAIAREVGNRAGEGTALSNIAHVYDVRGLHKDALDTYEQALAIRRDVGDRAGEGRTLNNIAAWYENQGRYEEALDMYEQALAIAREVGDRDGEGITLSNMAFLHDEQGRYEEALQTYQQAADVLESVRAVAGSEGARAVFIDQYMPTYDGMIEAALHLNQPETVFLASERGRARAFLDSLATDEVQLGDVRNDNLLAQEQAVYAARQVAQDALAAAYSLNPGDPALVAQREAELQKADQQMEQVRSKIAAQGEQLAALVPGRSSVLTLPQVQALLDNDTTLVSFWMLEDRTLAFVVTADGFTVVELPDATPEAVQGAVAALYDWKSRENPFPRPLRNLYTWLVAPLAPHLTTSRVAIIPHQQLHYVPFAALTDGEHYFGQQHTLSLLPSATSLHFLQQNAQEAQQRGWDKVLVFGNPATDLPPLPFAEDEAQAVGEIFHTAVYTGTQASEAQLRQQVEGSAIVHLAAHGSYNQANSLYSTIALAPGGDDDGRLEAHEVYALPLKGTELVTLSACQTSVGTLSQGDEVVGLTRAFFFAGTPTVLSSLWSVDDDATSALMTAFYRNWQQKGMDKAAALQAAQAEVAANPEWRSPFYWAAFVLHGDPGETQ